jgi:hypothetical protein
MVGVDMTLHLQLGRTQILSSSFSLSKLCTTILVLTSSRTKLSVLSGRYLSRLGRGLVAQSEYPRLTCHRGMQLGNLEHVILGRLGRTFLILVFA